VGGLQDGGFLEGGAECLDDDDVFLQEDGGFGEGATLLGLEGGLVEGICFVVDFVFFVSEYPLWLGLCGTRPPPPKSGSVMVCVGVRGGP